MKENTIEVPPAGYNRRMWLQGRLILLMAVLPMLSILLSFVIAHVFSRSFSFTGRLHFVIMPLFMIVVFTALNLAHYRARAFRHITRVDVGALGSSLTMEYLEKDEPRRIQIPIEDLKVGVRKAAGRNTGKIVVQLDWTGGSLEQHTIPTLWTLDKQKQLFRLLKDAKGETPDMDERILTGPA